MSYRDKTILAVVPARGGSKGIKLKNLMLFNGVPLVETAGGILQNLPLVDRSIVSTDHSEIARVACQAGLEVPFCRPPELSGDLVSDSAVMRHALAEMERIDSVIYDVLVLLQPTSPFRQVRHVEAVITKLIDGDYDSVLTVSTTDSKSHPLKQLRITGENVTYYDKSGGQVIARQQLTPVYHRNGLAYAVTRQCLLDQDTMIGENASAVIVDEDLVNIDTLDDVRYGEWLLERKLKEGIVSN